jgi:hypothetical protein
MKRFLSGLLVAATLLAPACASKVPPNLTPAATVAWYDTQVLKALDLFRDAVVDANALTPPLVSEKTTRRVVAWHESTIKIIHAIPAGWESTVTTGLDELVRDLPVSEAKVVAPYVTLIETTIKEITR